MKCAHALRQVDAQRALRGPTEGECASVSMSSQTGIGTDGLRASSDRWGGIQLGAAAGVRHQGKVS